MNIKKLSALVAVSALVLTGCATAAETETDTGAAPASDFKICVYTHGDGGGFWSVAQAGAEQAGKDLGVTVDYQGSTNDSAKQAQTIEAGIAGGCDAIAASAPDPGAIGRNVGSSSSRYPNSNHELRFCSIQGPWSNHPRWSG